MKINCLLYFIILPIVAMGQSIKEIKSTAHFSPVFTQGIIIEDNIVWESSGLYGKSMLTKWDILTGKVIKQRKFDKKYFAEGLTQLNGKLYLLTWRENTAFEIDKNTLKTLKTFKYKGEGWGLTSDGNQLIMSNGTQFLQFIDPKTFKVTGTTKVHIGETPISKINELEYIDGLIWANIYQTDYIIVINPLTGNVIKSYDFAHLLKPSNKKPGVLNGIAYDNILKKTWLTGKNWPLLFEL